MNEYEKLLAKVIENYFGADAGYLDIDVFTLAKRITEAGWENPVRCKDCKHWHNGAFCTNVKTMGLGLAIRNTKHDDFCSYGERK